jgi:hypothetical protein
MSRQATRSCYGFPMRSCALVSSFAVLVGIASAEPVKSKARSTSRSSTSKASPVTPVASKTAKAKAKPKKGKATAHASKRDMSRYETPADLAEAPGYRYGLMDEARCLAELDARKLPYVREAKARGVVIPVRLTGALHGVTFRTNLAASARATTPWEIADCRLVLALDDFARVLEAHHVVDVRHYSMYRAPDKSWPDDKPGIRHGGALAIDAARFTFQDGTYVDVDKHWNGAIGAKTCGPGAEPHPVTPEATELRAILCETAARHIFNFHLTPNYNRPHHNHFHLEVTAGFKYFMAH